MSSNTNLLSYLFSDEKKWFLVKLFFGVIPAIILLRDAIQVVLLAGSLLIKGQFLTLGIGDFIISISPLIGAASLIYVSLVPRRGTKLYTFLESLLRYNIWLFIPLMHHLSKVTYTSNPILIFLIVFYFMSPVIVSFLYMEKLKFDNRVRMEVSS
jgi:hypothetical protein